MTEEHKLKFIANFWRRIGALLIDTTILGLFGYLIGLGLEKQFIALGGWGKFIGFFIALIYLGVMNSSVTDGQTFGKKILKLRVVNSKNQTISLFRSFLRYSIIGIPFFLNNARFTTEALQSAWIYPLSLIIFGGILSTIYMYAFNRITRQSLHDMITGTFVVNASAEIQPINPVWKPHFIVISIILIATAIMPFFTTSLAQRAPFKELLMTQKALADEAQVNYATIQYGQSSINSNTSSYVSLQIYLKQNSVGDEALAKKLAIIAISKFKDTLQKDVIQINLIYGYDIGITSKWHNQTYNFKPKDLVTH